MDLLVSIIIPVYNRERLLAETLDSVRAQTYTNWECILVDDGSTDRSAEVIALYRQRDARFKFFRRPESRNKGANACRNFGFEQSKGEFVNWFDSDDVLHRDFLKIKTEALRDNRELDAVISKRAVFIDSPANIVSRENRTFLSRNTLEDFITLAIAWYIQDGMWRRSFLEGKKLFDEELLAGQDRDFHTRMLLHDPRLSIVDAYLAYNRAHDSSITASLDKQKDVRLKVSHMESVGRLTKILKDQGRLSKKIRRVLFSSMVKYLPYVYRNRKNFHTLLAVLKALSYPSLSIVTGWAKFWTGWAAFTLTGKGEKLLK